MPPKRTAFQAWGSWGIISTKEKKRKMGENIWHCSRQVAFVSVDAVTLTVGGQLLLILRNLLALPGNRRNETSVSPNVDAEIRDATKPMPWTILSCDLTNGRL